MLVAPQPWLSLTPTTKRLWARASAITVSRSARVSSLALGDALTISKPSSPAAISRVEPVPVVAPVLRQRGDRQRTVVPSRWCASRVSSSVE